MYKRLIIFLFALMSVAVAGRAQQYSTAIFKDNISTLRLKYADTDELERPFLTLSGDEQLDISFDELSHDTHFYTYTLVHLNHDFTRSPLQSSEYLEGFTTADISDYDHSSLTQTLYTHYRLLFPNDEMRAKVSGNYAIVIYEDGNPDDIVATVVFQVAEQSADISASVRGNTDIEFNNRLQQLDIDVDLQSNNITNPSEVMLVVTQNNRTDNQVVLSRPTFINNNLLRYVNQKALIFEGGNEYRRFDISSVYIKGTHVDQIVYDHRDYHAFLFADELRADMPYVNETDADGQYVINVEKRTDNDYEADYMFVHFMLNADEPFLDGRMYVAGDFTQNMLTPNNMMQYDAEHHCYTYTALLKQGGYEYNYLLVRKAQSSATTIPAEGSHWQTQNEYTILVYYHPFGARYDRLLAIKRIR